MGLGHGVGTPRWGAGGNLTGSWTARDAAGSRGRWWTRSGPVPARAARYRPSQAAAQQACDLRADPGVTMMGLPAASSTGCHVFMFSITAWPPSAVQTHQPLREGSPGSGLQGSLLALLLGPAPSRLGAAASGKLSAVPWWERPGQWGVPYRSVQAGRELGAQGPDPRTREC